MAHIIFDFDTSVIYLIILIVILIIDYEMILYTDIFFKLKYGICHVLSLLYCRSQGWMVSTACFVKCMIQNACLGKCMIHIQRFSKCLFGEMHNTYWKVFKMLFFFLGIHDTYSMTIFNIK